jgi:hypothetical protein
MKFPQPNWTELRGKLNSNRCESPKRWFMLSIKRRAQPALNSALVLIYTITSQPGCPVAPTAR